MPDKDGINGPFANGQFHCAHCDRWIRTRDDEWLHRNGCGPQYRAGVLAIERGKNYEDGVERFRREFVEAQKAAGEEADDGLSDVPSL